MKWTRTIDSAQRLITVERPNAPTMPCLTRLAFHIQGITAHEGERIWQETYADMAERGVREEGERPLSLWQRLKREEAMVGLVDFSQLGSTRLVLWSKPRIEVIFDMEDPETADLFRECEIMVLSAGFHFKMIGAEDRTYKTGLFG